MHFNTSVLPGDNQCLTASDSPYQPNQPCKLPFTVDGKDYNYCPWISTFKAYACPTKVDENGVFVPPKGCLANDMECYNNGVCGPNCPLEPKGNEANPSATTEPHVILPYDSKIYFIFVKTYLSGM